jgi:hypothetical protein
MLSGGFWLFGAILIVIAVVLVILFAVGLSRSSNVRHRASEVDAPNIPHDPTASKAADGVLDTGSTGGNVPRSVPFKQDVHQGEGDQITRSNRV